MLFSVIMKQATVPLARGTGRTRRRQVSGEIFWFSLKSLREEVPLSKSRQFPRREAQCSKNRSPYCGHPHTLSIQRHVSFGSPSLVLTVHDPPSKIEVEILNAVEHEFCHATSAIVVKVRIVLSSLGIIGMLSRIQVVVKVLRVLRP